MKEPSKHRSKPEESDATKLVGAVVFIGLAAFTAFLGYWQLTRRQWKIELIELRNEKLKGEPKPLLSVLWQETDGFQKVTCTGVLDYSRQFKIGPRGSPIEPTGPQAGENVGYYLVTPLVMDCGEILVNRGWVSKYSASSECAETEKGTIEVSGVLRDLEKPNSYMDGYKPELEKRESIICDALVVEGMDIKPITGRGGVTAKQAMIDLAEVNGKKSTSGLKGKTVESYVDFHTTPQIHAIYAGTWMTLSAAIIVMTALRFRKPKSKVIPQVVTSKTVLGAMPAAPKPPPEVRVKRSFLGAIGLTAPSEKPRD